MFLEMEDPGKPIEMMINSPGGKVAAGLAIYDWMQLIKSPVHTMCWGRCSCHMDFLHDHPPHNLLCILHLSIATNEASAS